MKIMLRNRRFQGGAAISALEYGKLMRRMYGEGEVELVAAGQYAGVQETYAAEGIRTYDVPYFENNHPWRNLTGLIRYVRVLRRERVDLIVAIAVCNGMLHRIVSRMLGIPVLTIVPGGEIPGSFAAIMGDTPLVVFSEENKRALTDAGYDESRIRLITNRLVFEPQAPAHMPAAHYARPLHGEPVRLLLISRLDGEKMRSVHYVLDCVAALVGAHQSAGASGATDGRPALGGTGAAVSASGPAALPPIRLTLLGDGDYIAEVRARAAAINAAAGGEVVRVAGFRRDVKAHIDDAHIVFGKGRSIIEPVYHGRIAFVVNEAEQMWQCTPQTLPRLQATNFSGRALQQPDALVLLERRIREAAAGAVDPAPLEESSAYIARMYDIRHAAAAIDGAVRALAPPTGAGRLTVLGVLRGGAEFVRIYVKLTTHYMRRAAARRRERAARTAAGPQQRSVES
ncbi:hypothetical protein IDH44_12110 [Paenibacillus sp. IB182496]|uniref:Glycosyltransferase subfamily 4-like N-terminal domain-containing protein n=1 Tax=Paenibacillus sabuli TaxID=2772509 RepID=A0A927GRR7_9BACL|nr:glycosyltransferase [Paenibacillus sabuli]MBD2845939.1 hypothetical protein [Paenibacillus sabuli]